MPTTRLGKWAGWSGLSAVVLLALLIVAYNTDALGSTFSQGTVGGVILWVLAAIAAVAGLVTGAVSLFRFKDRSIVVIASTVYGLLNTTLLAFGAMPQA